MLFSMLICRIVTTLCKYKDSFNWCCRSSSQSYDVLLGTDVSVSAASK